MRWQISCVFVENKSFFFQFRIWWWGDVWNGSLWEGRLNGLQSLFCTEFVLRSSSLLWSRDFGWMRVWWMDWGNTEGGFAINRSFFLLSKRFYKTGVEERSVWMMCFSYWYIFRWVCRRIHWDFILRFSFGWTCLHWSLWIGFRSTRWTIQISFQLCREERTDIRSLLKLLSLNSFNHSLLVP